MSFDCAKLPEQKLACTRIKEVATGKILAEGFLIAGTAESIALFDGKENKVFSRSTDYVIEIIPAFP